MHDYSNNKSHDPHGFKKEIKIKIKYNTVKAVAKRFPNRIAVMMVLLKAEAVPLTWIDYCVMPPAD